LESLEFKVFRSSAGSGKTYQLALEFLKIALEKPDSFNRILAVTFTNKATNEMKARIIDFLFDLSNDNADESLVNTFSGALKLNRIQLIDRARLTLQMLLHSYSNFSVSTIDSFFQRVISAFSRDLGIQGGYDLEFDLDKVKDAITDRLFIKLDQNPKLKEWLVRFALSKIESNKSWDIRYDIRQLSGQIFYESFSSHYKVLSEKISDTTQMSDMLDDIKVERKKIMSGIKKYGQDGLDRIKGYGLEVSDFFQGEKGPAGFYSKMVAGVLNINLSSTYLKNGLEALDSWFSKKSKKQEVITSLLQDGLFEHYKEAYNFYSREIIKDNTYNEVQKYFFYMGILKNLIEGVKEYRNLNDVVLISDLTYLLNTVIGDNDAPFIYEKVGSFYRNFLIDEFQDTSRYQWDNFLPLILNSLSMGNINMIVGDVKQSIYRWRGGDWEVLQRQVDHDIGQFPIKVKPLSDNWRSLKHIVSFNNSLFKSLEGILKNKMQEEIEKITEQELRENVSNYADRFSEAYSDVQQDLPKERTYTQDGLVQIQFVAGSEDHGKRSSWKESVLPELVEIIKQLQDKGYQPRDLAILVRTKEEGRKVANYLLNHKRNSGLDKRYSFEVISSESLFLRSSPAINVVIYFLQLVIDKQDIIATANFYYWLFILKSGSENIDYAEIFQKSRDGKYHEELNFKLLDVQGQIDFERYRSVPIIDLIEEVIILLNLHDYPNERAYLLGLQNVTLEYLEKNTNDIHSFIRWWFEEGENRSIKPSMDQNSILILTIHQSKGLQFKHVLIPYCSWDIDHSSRNDNMIWGSSKLPVLDRIPVYPIRYSKQLGQSDFADSYFNEKSLAYMDNLNLLYVALTRAEVGLFVFAELPGNLDRIQTVGDLILNILNDKDYRVTADDNPDDPELRSFWDEENNLFKLGDMPLPEDADKKGSLYSLNEFETGSWYNMISIRRQADILSKDDIEATGEKINYGILLHDILSMIHRKDQVDDILASQVVSGEITHDDKIKLSSMLNKLLADEKISNWFTDNWEIKTEVPVLPDKGNLRRMDRVMIKNDAAIVVDYKTGEKRSADINQVKNYKNILRQMGYKRIKGYVLYLNNGELIEV
jgi:ATP-dependent exoDNAse (exonuclease V) beta subunit